MHCSNNAPDHQPDLPVIALVGNPNVGKSVIFSLFTGRYVIVSNYPGTTVEVSSGTAILGGTRIEVIDTPGVNSLTPRSEDEEVARAILIDRKPCAVVQVADGKNLRRSLMITTQLAEMGMPVTMALNMWDEALDRGIEVDSAELSKITGVPVIKTVAVQKQGVGALQNSITGAARPTLKIDFGREIESEIEKLMPHLPDLTPDSRGLALMLIAGDYDLEERLGLEITEGTPGEPATEAATGGDSMPAEGILLSEQVANARQRLEKLFSEPLSYVISRKRAAYVDEIVEKVMTLRGSAKPHTIYQKTFFVAAGPLLGVCISAITVSLLLAALNAFVELGGAFRPLFYLLTLMLSSGYCLTLWRRRSTGSAAEVSGKIAMHPVLGFPVLLAVLAGLYLFVGVFGAEDVVHVIEDDVFGVPGEPGEGIPLLFGELQALMAGSARLVVSEESSIGHFLLNEEDGLLTTEEKVTIPFAGINYHLGSLARRIMPEEGFVYDLLFSDDAGLISKGLTYSIAIVLPIVAFFFFAFGLLEDSGYLPRLAVMVDWLFKRVGLNGKAVLPMVLGLGCGTMATLTTRILETRRQRILATLLLALAIPCSAQVGIIAGVLASIGGGTAFAFYIVVILLQFIVIGYLASKVLGGENSDFVLEVPPFRMPKIRNVMLKTLYRMKWFMKEAVPLFLLGTLILFILTRVGYNENTRPMGLLSVFDRLAAPVTTNLLGLPGDQIVKLEGDHDHHHDDDEIVMGSTSQAFLLSFLRRDYGAVAIRQNYESEYFSRRQSMVALIVITLFVPCLANLFVIVKERGLKTSLLIVGFVIPYAFIVGGVVNLFLRMTGLL